MIKKWLGQLGQSEWQRDLNSVASFEAMGSALEEGASQTREHLAIKAGVATGSVVHLDFVSGDRVTHYTTTSVPVNTHAFRNVRLIQVEAPQAEHQDIG